MKLDFRYDGNGNITRMNDKSYSYDKNNQLIRAYTSGKFIDQEPTVAQAGIRLDDQLGKSEVYFDVNQQAVVKLDYAATSIGLDFGGTAPAVKKIQLVPAANSPHRLAENALDLFVSTDNLVYMPIPRSDWDYEKAANGVITLTLKQATALRYLKVRIRFDERDQFFRPVDKATFLNELAKTLQVYQEANGRTEEYQYDAAGNRTLLRVTLVGTTGYVSKYYHNSDRLMTDGKYAFEYDKAGNMIKKGNRFTINGNSVTFNTSEPGAEYWTYQYDLLNRLIAVTKNGTLVASYQYDPTGLRIVKKTAVQKIHYVFEGTEPIFEKNITTGKIKSYVYALGKHLARVDGVIGDPNAKKYFYHTDHQGSIKAVTDMTGKVVYRADYHAFGTRFGKVTDTDFDEVRGFNGKEFDADIGLYYYNARWYDPELGRFISEDPAMDPNNPNLYSYCRNNPLVFTDPTGLCTDCESTGGSDYDPKNDPNNLDFDKVESYYDAIAGNDYHNIDLCNILNVPNPNNPGGLPPDVTNITRYKNGQIKGYVVPGTGKDQIQYNFNKDGTVKSITSIVYNGAGSRTKVHTEFSKHGVTVTYLEQTQNIFGWSNKEVDITGYNSKEDMKKGSWNFKFDNQGRISLGNNVRVVNGDLLLEGFLTYLLEENINYVGWLFGLANSKWDVTNIPGIRDVSFRVNGRNYNANTFGNIEVGYIGAFFNNTTATKAGSVYIHLERHGLNFLEDEFGNDHRWMDYGTDLYLNNYPYGYTKML